MRLLWILVAFTLALPSVADARRTHVRINKPYYAARPVQPIAVPVVAIVPLGLFYDLARRTNCQGDVLGLGGPGFSSPITPATGNVMTTAYMRGECAATPR